MATENTFYIDGSIKNNKERASLNLQPSFTAVTSAQPEHLVFLESSLQHQLKFCELGQSLAQFADWPLSEVQKVKVSVLVTEAGRVKSVT